MLFEIRRYRIFEGKRDEFVRLMETEVIPFQISLGMSVVGSFTAEEEDDLYVWIRRFASEEDRVRLYEAVYESDRWKNDLGPLIGTMLDRSKIEVTRLNPTSISPLH